MRIFALFPLAIFCSNTARPVPHQAPLIPNRGGYHVVHYNSDNGLPQNTVSDLLMDRNHFLWIATQNGLVRWDGQRFSVYNTSNTPALKSNRFSLLSASPNGKILIKSNFDDSLICHVTEDYGIREDTTYTRLPMKLISYHSNGIFDYGKLVSAVAHRKYLPGEGVLLDRLYHASAFWIFNDHEAIAADGDAYYYLNSLSATVQPLRVRWHPEDPPKAFPVGQVFILAQNDGNFFSFENGRATAVRPDETAKRLLMGPAHAKSTDFFIHAKGNITLLRRNNDFYSLAIKNNTLTATLLFRDLTCMENQPVNTMVYDSSTNMLILGTLNAGLWIITHESFRTLTFPSKNFIDNVFMSFRPLPNGLILTHNGMLDPADGKESRLFADTGRIDRVCIYRSADSSLWCSKNKRLYHYGRDFTGGRLIDTARLESYITGMTADTGNTFWISTFSSLLKLKNGRLQTVIDHYPDFVHHTIESIAEISPTVLWLATRDGLFAFDKTAGKLVATPILPHTYVPSIFKARDGSLWIGSYGSGYFKYWQGAFLAMPLDADRYLEEANGFLEDKKGFLWISTNHGLFSIRKADLDSIARGTERQPFFYYYDRSYGLATNEFNGGCNPAAAEDGSGRFYFPSMNGLVCFSPDSCQGELPDKPLYIDAISIDSVKQQQDGAQLHVSPDFTRILVQVSTPFYAAPENLRIEYSLSPDKWYPVNRNGNILINRLPSGSYELQIRKRNGWSDQDYATLSIPFKVRPYWYNTPIFRIVSWIFLLLSAVWLRTRFLQKQNLRLQIMVNERTAELEKSTLIKENLLSIIMHDLRSPLGAQNLLIEHIHKDFRHMAPDMTEHLLQQLLESGKSIAQFSTDFLIWYDSQQENFTVTRRNVPLLPLLDSIVQVYLHATVRKGIDLTYTVAPDLEACTDAALLAIIIRNLLDNAIQHTKQGSIAVKAFREDQRIVIQIADTGRGMLPDKIKELYGPSTTTRASGHSFGYRFIREFSQRLGAELNIVSEPGLGTTVTVSLAD